MEPYQQKLKCILKTLMIDHVLKRLPILPNSNLLSMKGNTKERVRWQLLQYCCEVRLAPNHALYVTSIIGASLSEHHIDELNVRNLYISRSEPHTGVSN